MYRNLYRFFPLATATSTTNTTLISLKLLNLHRSSISSSNNNNLSRKYFTTMTTEFYNLEALDIKKNPYSFSNLNGKVVLVVNVASACGYTPQYTGLEALHSKYKDEGLVVVGFPCNQFGLQEPGTEEEIVKFCSSTYNVSFPLFAKIDVNGENESSVYKHLKSKQPGDIAWNFEKFLVDKKGNVVKKYLCKIKPEDIESDIKACLEG